MTEPFTPPPARELPEGVRERARAELLAGMESERRPRRWAAPVAVAASVVVFAAAAMAVTVDWDGDQGGRSADVPAAGHGAVGPEQAFSVTDGASDEGPGCQGPAATAGISLDGWRPAFTAKARGVTLIPYRKGDKVLFCEISPTDVAVSEPVTVPDTAMFWPGIVSRSGSVGGVVGEGLRAVTVHGVPAFVRDGIVVAPNTAPKAVADRKAELRLRLHFPDGGGVWQGDGPPAFPAPETAVQYAARGPAGGKSDGQRTFTRCLTQSQGPPVVDPNGWRAGEPRTEPSGETLQAGRYGHDLAALCVSTQDGGSRLVVGDGAPGGIVDLVGDGPAVIASAYYGFREDQSETGRSDVVALAGTVDEPRAVRAQVVLGDGTVVGAPITNGTFVIPGISARAARGSLVLRDADGSQVSSQLLRF